MKILYFNYHYEIEGMSRGAAVQIRSIAAGLERLGHEVDLHFRAAKRNDRDSRILPGLKRIRPLRRYGHVPKLLFRNIRLGRESRRIIDESRPDVLMAVSSYFNLSAMRSAGSRRIPFVLYCETPLEYEYSLFLTQYCAYSRLGRWVEGINVRSADQVICVSEILKNYLMRYQVPAARLHVVPNGADHIMFRPQPPDRELRDKFGLRGKTVIGFVGSFNFFTDVDNFTALVKRVCDRYPGAVFLFVGKGEAGDRIRVAGEERGLAGRMIFTGSVPHDEVPRFLSLVDIAISPYRGDYMFYGSAMKPMEYMAAGKAVLVSALGQIRELIEDGQNGMLFVWDDYREMEEKLLALIADKELRRRLGANARRTIEEGWTWDLQASRIARVLQTAVEGRR